MPGNRRRGRPPHPDILTPAEWQVTHGVRHGMTNREIARRGTSLDAVKFHVANAVAKLGVPNRAALRRWRGSPAGSAVGKSRGYGMEQPVELGPIGQISLGVSDIRRAVAWYRDALGLPHLFTFGDLAFFDCGGVRLFLSVPEGGGSPDRGSIIYFRVGDIHAAYDELSSRGVGFHGAPHLIHRHESGVEEWMAFFDDPDGNTLAIMSQVAAPG